MPRAPISGLVLVMICLSTLALAAGPRQQDPSTWRQRPEVAARQERDSAKKGTHSAEAFQVLPGFQVELLFTVPQEELGSWVCLATDNRGRLIASDQGTLGLCRITPPPVGSRQETQVERLRAPLSSAQGMVYAFDSLYVVVNGDRTENGLYRLRDTDGDDQFDSVTPLKKLNGNGEHGPHAVCVGPDGQSLYVICGNHTNLPAIDSSCIPTNWNEDLLLPRQWDALGHAVGRLAPGGFILKTDPEGRRWEVVSIGYRNSYDIGFNADGELFTYDADMEWDLGTPWYRPTRICHATSGSEFGWRSGTGKWPIEYADSLPPVVPIGPGSPVGITFGYGAKFPAKYQRALYALDWTFGTMYAIHLQPQGASYTGEREEFLSRTPLPLTDAVVGADGALYFTVGGRGTQSALYRVTYTGRDATSPAVGSNSQLAELRKLRQSLEAFHRKQKDPAPAIGLAWANLGHADRHIRYAARIALEHQDAPYWQDRVLNDSAPLRVITGTIGLARQGLQSLQDPLLAALDRIDFPQFSTSEQVDLLRAYQLVLIRMGKPSHSTVARTIARLDLHYPSTSWPVNRELCQLLVYLNSPTVIDKTLSLMSRPAEQSLETSAQLLARNEGYGQAIAKMLANQPEIHNFHYVFALRNMRYGWTLEQRRTFFDWLQGATAKSGGESYQGFIKNIRDEALANASESERQALQVLASATLPTTLPEIPKPLGPGKDWTLEDVMSLTESGLKDRDFAAGKRAYAAARCVVCHRFDGTGGATGPDLTNVVARFSIRDLTEAIMQPSKVISDQYRASIIHTADGKTFTGRITSQQGGNITVVVDPENASKIIELTAQQIEQIEPSAVSLMPDNLLKPLNRDEVADLLAYLLSRGNPEDPMFVHR